MNEVSRHTDSWGVDLSVVNQSVDNALYKSLVVFGKYLENHNWNLQIDESFCTNFRNIFDNTTKIKDMSFDDDTIKRLYNDLKRSAMSLQSQSTDIISNDAITKYNINVLKKFLIDNVWDNKCDSAYNELKSGSEREQNLDLLSEVERKRDEADRRVSLKKYTAVEYGNINGNKIRDILSYYVDENVLLAVNDSYSINPNGFGDNEKSIEMMSTILSVLKSFDMISSSNFKYINIITSDIFPLEKMRPYLSKEYLGQASSEFGNTLKKIISLGLLITDSYKASSFKDADTDLFMSYDIFSSYIGLLMNKTQKNYLPIGVITYDGQYYSIADKETIDRELNVQTHPKIKDTLVHIAENVKKMNQAMERALTLMFPEYDASSDSHISYNDKYYEDFERLNVVFSKYTKLLTSRNFYHMLDILCGDSADELNKRFTRLMYVYGWSLIFNKVHAIDDMTATALVETIVPNVCDIIGFDGGMSANMFVKSPIRGTCAQETPKDDYDTYIYNISDDLYRILNKVQNPGDEFDKYYDFKENDDGSITYFLYDETIDNPRDIYMFFKGVSDRIQTLKRTNPKHNDVLAIHKLLCDVNEQLQNSDIDGVIKECAKYMAYGHSMFKERWNTALQNKVIVRDEKGRYLYNPSADRTALDSLLRWFDSFKAFTSGQPFSQYGSSSYVFQMFTDQHKKINSLNAKLHR